MLTQLIATVYQLVILLFHQITCLIRFLPRPVHVLHLSFMRSNGIV